MEHVGAPLRGAKIQRALQFLEQETRQGSGTFQSPLEFLLPMAPYERVRVLAFGQEQEFHLLAVLELRDRVLERAPRRAPPRAVAVEAEHDLVGLAQELLYVQRRRRRAERRHRVLDPAL